MIRLANPANLGPAIGQIRRMLGHTRPQLAQLIADATGRDPSSIEKQLWAIEQGGKQVRGTTAAPILDALGYDLALVEREDA